MISNSKCIGFHYHLKSQICKSVNLFFRDADKVLIGDDVLVYANEELSSEKVTKISSFAMHGKIFTILTITMKTLVFNVEHHSLFLSLMTACWF